MNSSNDTASSSSSSNTTTAANATVTAAAASPPPPSPSYNWVGDSWFKNNNVGNDGGQRQQRHHHHPAAYTVEEMRELFSRECSLFVGDSLQRRAAETLWALLSGSDPNDVPSSGFKNVEIKVRNFNGRKERSLLPVGPNSNGTNSSSDTSVGCLDTEWRPKLKDMGIFARQFRKRPDLYGKYTFVVAGSAIWDAHTGTTLAEFVDLTKDAVENMHKHVHVHSPTTKDDDDNGQQQKQQQQQELTWVWKTGGFCPDKCEKTSTNEKIAAANEAAMSMINGYNQQAQAQAPAGESSGGGNINNSSSSDDASASDARYVDWASAVKPRSTGNSKIKSADGHVFHYGLQPRLLLLDMLSSVLDEKQQRQRMQQQHHLSEAVAPPSSSTTSSSSARRAAIGGVAGESPVPQLPLSSLPTQTTATVALAAAFLLLSMIATKLVVLNKNKRAATGNHNNNRMTAGTTSRAIVQLSVLVAGALFFVLNNLVSDRSRSSCGKL